MSLPSYFDNSLHPKRLTGEFPDRRKFSTRSDNEYKKYCDFYHSPENWLGMKRWLVEDEIADIKAKLEDPRNREHDFEWLEQLELHRNLLGAPGQAADESTEVIAVRVRDHYKSCLSKITNVFKGANIQKAFSAAYASIIFGRHLYIEGSSGTGKTALIRAACRSFGNIPYDQFDATSDATDINLVGGEIPRSTGGGFEFDFQRGPLLKPGALCLVIDELPRLPAATTNVLLQGMAERKVTISLVASGKGATTFLLSPSFSVIGMGNPVGYGGQGERSLALYDRFDIGIEMDHPNSEARLEIYSAAANISDHKAPDVTPSERQFDLYQAQRYVDRVEIPDPILKLLLLASYYVSPEEFRNRVCWGDALPAAGKAAEPQFYRKMIDNIENLHKGRDYIAKLISRLKVAVKDSLVEGSNPRGEISAIKNAQVHALINGRAKVDLADMGVGFQWATFARLKTYPGAESARRSIIEDATELFFTKSSIERLLPDIGNLTDDQRVIWEKFMSEIEISPAQVG